MLRAKQVSFRYPQEGHGLPPISMQAVPGELTLVTGPSGCGKSTLARCLMGLIPHLYHGELLGEVWLNGYRTSEVPMWQLAEKAGMVFQNPAAQMLAPSVEDEIIFGLENLGLGRDEIKHRLETVLDNFHLAHMRERNPQTLSGGEQQRLALAAIMSRQPEALILDEPLSMLDTTAATELIAYLKGLASDGKTLVMFEHRHEYLDGVSRLRHLSLPGKQKNNEFQQCEIPQHPQAKFRLEIEDLSVNLGGRIVLGNLNLSLSGGQIVAVVGCNGVGKTTLLRALSGLQKHTGSARIVTFQGDQRPDLGMVFQNPDLQLFNASVRDEILYRLPDPDMAYYRRLVAALGLEPYENTPPLLLSEGEKRVALGLVTMRRPAHGLLLDEPSLGQDHVHKDILMRLLRALTDAGQLVVITTHDMTLAAQADRLILLGTEGVVADGDTQLVLQNHAAWQKAGVILPNWFLRSRETEARPMRISQAGRSRQMTLVSSSPLRMVDPRTKLFISMAISLVVMMPLERLAIFMAIYILFLLWTRLLRPAAQQVWRIKWILLLLFVFDWWLIDITHAVTICTRLILLTGVFALFFSTTTSRELGLALEKLRLPYRYAFSLGLAFQSLGLLDDEWRSIREAQSSRGALPEISSFQRLISQIGDLVSLTVPTIVLTTKRAWAITEAAYAREFDSPHRTSYRTLAFSHLDVLLATGTVTVIILLYWRW